MINRFVYENLFYCVKHVVFHHLRRERFLSCLLECRSCCLQELARRETSRELGQTIVWDSSGPGVWVSMWVSPCQREGLEFRVVGRDSVRNGMQYSVFSTAVLGPACVSVFSITPSDQRGHRYGMNFGMIVRLHRTMILVSAWIAGVGIALASAWSAV